MKKIFKNQLEPRELLNFREGNPNGNWDQLKDNRDVYSSCKNQIFIDQFYLCAYCECKIIVSDPLTTRIEHFHPKSDSTDLTKNWALVWDNLIGVCNGGDRPGLSNYEAPLPQNLSCDAHKAHMDNLGKLEKNCEGWILNPIYLMNFPCVFKINFENGCLSANESVCGTLNFQENRFKTAKELVENTIIVLNLNCDRLVKKRVVVLREIERNIKKWRTSNQNVSQNLVSLYFGYQWRPFFTTIRLRLGNFAEEYLKSINFQG